MRTPPHHDRAALSADGETLRRCAGRLGELAGARPAGAAADWGALLAALARRCEVAAADLEAAAELFAEDAGGAGLPGPGPKVQSNSDPAGRSSVL